MSPAVTLAALLLAKATVDLGDAAGARAHLREAMDLEAASSKKGKLNYGVVLGGILRLEGDLAGARDAWEKARRWGEAAGFSNFVFQPALLVAHADLATTSDTDDALARARGILQHLVEGAGLDRSHIERYAGEIYALYALVHALGGGFEEAKVWMDQAQAWLADRQEHRVAAEICAIAALLASLRAQKLEENGGKKAQVEGLRGQARARVRTTVTPLLEALRASFADPEQGRAFVECHPATVLLRTYGGLDPFAT